MAQIWIKGKPVVPASDEELLRLLALADAAPPEAEAKHEKRVETATAPTRAATQPPEDRPSGHRFRGAFAKQDAKTQEFLRMLAYAYPKAVTGDVIKEQLALLPKFLAGMMLSMTKRFGKGTVVKTKMHRQGKSRTYEYRLTPATITLAREEGWTRQPARLPA